MQEKCLEKIEIEKLGKEQFQKYREQIEEIHEENKYPHNGFLLDEDYITGADLIFVAICEGKVVGYISISTEKYEPVEGENIWTTIRKENMKIKQIAIKKEFQDLKIGTTLINRVKEYAQSKNIKDIYLYTMKENEKARKFYETNGFKFSGTWNTEEYKGIKNFQSHFWLYKNEEDKTKESI